jgi:hypothetical protein
VHIRADRLKRPLNEGADIDLTIKIDKSRKMTVEVFIASLNQGFADDVYVPDPPSTRSQLQQQLDLCFSRLHRVRNMIYAADREDLRERANDLEDSLEVVAEIAKENEDNPGRDPDALLEPTERLRRIRTAITQLEEQIEVDRGLSPLAIKLRGLFRAYSGIVREFGTPADKEAFERLETQFTRYAESGDQRGLAFVKTQFDQIVAGIVWNQPWYYENWHDFLSMPGRRYINQTESTRLLAQARQMREARDLPGLRIAVHQLNALLPPDEVEAAKEQSMRSGLKNQ